MDNNEFLNQIEITKLKKKLKRSRIGNIIFAIILVLIIISISVLGYFANIIYQNVKPHFRALFGNNLNLASVSQISKHNQIDLEKFTEKLAFIDDAVNLFYHYDNKDNKKIEDAMFTGYLNALGDKYAEYMPAKEFEDFTEKTTEGVYYGIGCVVNQDKKTKDCIVNLVYEDSPAERGGLKKEDIFISIDGENVRGKDLEYIVSKIRGEEGAKREIVVYRESEDKNVDLTVYCGKVDIKLVTTDIYEDNIGYIDLREFTGKSANQFKDAIDKMTSNENIKGLIIDLRGNPGGELQTVCQIIDYMVKDRDGRYTLNQKDEIFEPGKTLVVYIKERDQIVDAAYAVDGHEVDLPIVILTDYSTASAAELFTETMRDYKKATIVGVRTYGKGVVQQIIPLDDGSAVKFTISEYFPPSGYSIDKKGIIPDYSIDYSGIEIEYDKDNNIIAVEDDKKYVFNSEGQIIKEIPLDNKKSVVATISEISTKSNIDALDITYKESNVSTKSETDIDTQKEDRHIENLKIYDTDNEFLNEDWYIELDNKLDDKQLVQGIVVLKDMIK